MALGKGSLRYTETSLWGHPFQKLPLTKLSGIFDTVSLWLQLPYVVYLFAFLSLGCRPACFVVCGSLHTPAISLWSSVLLTEVALPFSSWKWADTIHVLLWFKQTFSEVMVAPAGLFISSSISFLKAWRSDAMVRAAWTGETSTRACHRAGWTVSLAASLGQ